MSENDIQKSLRRAVIKEELVALTGNHIQAIILNQFIYWSERTGDVDCFLEEERKRNPDADLELTYGWIYKSAKELRIEIMLSVSPTTIGRYLNKLVKAGYLDRRTNPKYKWDRCLQYRPNILKIQCDLQKLGYALANYPLRIEENPFSTVRDGNITVQNGNNTVRDQDITMQDQDIIMQDRNNDNDEALPEITTETTTKTTPEITTDGLACANRASDQPEISKLPHQQIFDTLVIVCAWDIELLTEKQRGQLNQTGKKLRLLKNQIVTSADVLAFGDWWQAKDWRGKQGEFPRPDQVRAEWGRFRHWQKQQATREDAKQQADIHRQYALAQAQAEAQADPELVAAKETWRQACAQLQGSLGRASFAAWVAPLQVLSSENDAFRLKAPNEQIQDWIEHRLRGAIERALMEVTGAALEVELCTQ